MVNFRGGGFAELDTVRDGRSGGDWRSSGAEWLEADFADSAVCKPCDVSRKCPPRGGLFALHHRPGVAVAGLAGRGFASPVHPLCRPRGREPAMSEAAEAKPAVPWRGRKRVADPRSEVIQVRCTPKQRPRPIRQRGTGRLERRGVPAALAVARRPARRAPAAGRDSKELARLLGELGKVGSNVNQMARVLNRGRRTAAEAIGPGLRARARSRNAGAP